MPTTDHIAAAILRKATLFDHREANPLAIAAWAEALDDDVTEADGLRAVSDHFGASAEYLLPKHINDLCKSARSRRVNDEVQRNGILLPEGLSDDPDVEVQWRRAAVYAIARGANRKKAGEYAWRVIGRTAPDSLDPAPVQASVTNIKTGPASERVQQITHTIGRTA